MSEDAELGPKLTPEEDAELRRLHFFEQTGNQLAPAVAVIKDSIRARDRRDEIRPPKDDVVIGEGVDAPVEAPKPPARRGR